MTFTYLEGSQARTVIPTQHAMQMTSNPILFTPEITTLLPQYADSHVLSLQILKQVNIIRPHNQHDGTE